MIINDIISAVETWAPPWAAWEKDNPGLQIGDSGRKVTTVLVALDVTREVVKEAIAQHAELIVSHHPLLFRPPKTVTTADPLGALLLTLAEHRISVFSAHTNLDSTRGGVSMELATRLGLADIRFLAPLTDTMAKIVVFLPAENVPHVQEAMASAGAGLLGEYSSCAFQTAGIGSFYGSASSHPFIGKPESHESVQELRLEMIVPRAKISAVVQAMKKAHPYEEPAFDIYPLLNSNINFGMGAIGELKKAQPLRMFLQTVKKALGAKALRYTGDEAQRVRRIAVCGGAGSELLSHAIQAQAEVFVTADVHYHTYQAASGRIALVDAGHYETEHVVLKPLAAFLHTAARNAGESLTVLCSQQEINPMKVS
jgi:dinuclear metal center YbgI/SA1388 family protein